MKECEDLKIINSRIAKHPDYDREKNLYSQMEMVSDYYTKAIDSCYLGELSIPREEQDAYYKMITRYSNMPVFCIELMKSLLTDEDRKDDCQICINIFRKSMNALKKKFRECSSSDRTRFAHAIFYRLKIPYANLKEYDPDGFLEQSLAVQIKKTKNIKKQHLQDGLREYYGRIINKLDSDIFSEKEILPAAIILDAYFDNDMKGMKNARYFNTIVANELDEIVDNKMIAETVKKLISHNYINGEIDGKYHFLIRN